MEAELRRLQQLTEQIDAPAMRASMLRTRAGLAIARGDIASAWPLAQRALTEGLASTDAGTARAIALLQFSALLGLRGDEAQEAIDVDNEVIVLHNSLMIAAGVYVQCLTARWDSALAQMRALAADHFACLPRDMSYGIALANLAYSSMMLRDRDSAQVLRELLLPFAGRHATVFSYYTSGSASHHIALLEATLGNFTAANAYFEQALKMNADMGYEVWQLQTALCFSQVCRQQGEAQRASELESAARALSQRLDIPFSAMISLSRARSAPAARQSG